MIADELQKAVFSALSSASICEGRIYDGVPHAPVFPYVTIGDENVRDSGNQCGDGWGIFFDVHAWSRPASASKVEVKQIAAAVRNAIVSIDSLSGFSLVSIEHQATLSRRESDGLTEHAAMTFRAEVDPA
jgi:hypothetical protein